MNSKHAKRVGVGLLAAVAVLGGTGVFAIGEGGEVISACVAKKDGTMRIATTCKSTETPLTWNQQGPQGTPGQQGIPGEKGADGAPGAQGGVGPEGPAWTTGSGRAARRTGSRWPAR